MKFIYQNLSLIMELKKQKLNILVLESPVIFEKTLFSLKSASDKKGDEISLYRNEEKCDFSRCADVIFSPFDLTYEKREIQKKLFLSLQNTAETQDLLSAFAETNGRVLELLSALHYQSEYQLDYAADFTLSEILKNYSVRLAEPVGNFAEKAIDYMTNIQKMLCKDVFIFVNCEAYLATEDYAHIAKFAVYYDIYILFLQNRQIYLNQECNEYIIDLDLCEIH